MSVKNNHCNLKNIVNVDLPPVVDEDVVHLEVGFLAALLVFKLDEGVLQAVAGFPIADHFATEIEQDLFTFY